MSLVPPKLAKGIKTRRHHNNKGTRQIKRGKTVGDVMRMAKRLGIPYGKSPASRQHNGTD